MRLPTLLCLNAMNRKNVNPNHDDMLLSTRLMHGDITYDHVYCSSTKFAADKYSISVDRINTPSFLELFVTHVDISKVPQTILNAVVRQRKGYIVYDESNSDLDALFENKDISDGLLFYYGIHESQLRFESTFNIPMEIMLLIILCFERNFINMSVISLEVAYEAYKEVYKIFKISELNQKIDVELACLHSLDIIIHRKSNSCLNAFKFMKNLKSMYLGKYRALVTPIGFINVPYSKWSTITHEPGIIRNLFDISAITSNFINHPLIIIEPSHSTERRIKISSGGVYYVLRYLVNFTQDYYPIH